MKPVTLSDAIVSTLAYYHALGGYPLTSFELYLRLNACDERPCFFEVLSAIETLRQQKTIDATNGFFFPNLDSPHRNPVKERIQRHKVSAGKWKKLMRALRWIMFLPYLRMIGVTGSLAINNSREESDIDLLIVTQPGRIWISRILCSLVTQLLGMRRYGKLIQDRICLNYYLASNALTLTVQNLSNAHTYANMVPVFDDHAWHQRFLDENNWMKDYLSSSYRGLHYSLRYAKRSALHRIIGSFLEALFQNPLGDFFEKTVGWLQKRKILASVSPPHTERKDQLLLSSRALMFHYPVSRNAEVEEKYKEIMTQLGK